MSRFSVSFGSAALLIFGICDVQAQPLQTPLPPNRLTVIPAPITPTPWYSNQIILVNPNLTEVQRNSAVRVYGNAWSSYQNGVNALDNNLRVRQASQNLNLTVDQYNRMVQAYGNAWASYQNGVNGLGDALTARQQEQQLRILQSAFYANLPANSTNAIGELAARNRQGQIDLQYCGYDALTDPAVEQKLNLTKDQRQQIEQRRHQWQKTMSDLNRTYSADRVAAVKEFNMQRANERQALNKILTPAQLTTWNQMTGEPYDFPPSVFFQSNSNAAKKSP